MFQASKQYMDQHLARLRTLGIERYAQELETDGYTIVPPEVTGLTPEKCDRLTELLFAHAEELTGAKFSLEEGPLQALAFPADGFTGNTERRSPARPAAPGTEVVKGAPYQILLQQLCRFDREFRDLAIHPVAVALIEHMVGPTVTRFSSHNAFIKWKGGKAPNLGMHADQAANPYPWGRNALTSNTNWCLTDYTPEDGPLALVPKSHDRHSRPTKDAEKEAIPVVCKRGSCVIFHGQTWHGAFPKKTDGLRVTISNYYAHHSVKAQEDIQNSFPRELAQDCADPELFNRLAGFPGMPGVNPLNNLVPYQDQKKKNGGGVPLPHVPPPAANL